MKKHSIRLSHFCTCAALLISAAPAAAEVYNYTFDDLSLGYIVGKDNWETAMAPGVNPMTVEDDNISDPPSAPHYGTGNLLTVFGGTVEYKVKRTNDAPWSFDLSDTPPLARTFTIQAETMYDCKVTGHPSTGEPVGGGEFLLRNSTTEKGIGFGVQVIEWDYALYIMDATGSKDYAQLWQPSYADAHPGNNEKASFLVRIVVDLDGYDGEGSATLYTRRLSGTPTDWMVVLGAHDVNLKLITAGVDIATLDQLYLMSQTRIWAFDDTLVKTPLPGDANLDDVVDGQDFTVLKASFGGSGKEWADGNFNTDVLVDGQDFTILKANFGSDQRNLLPTYGGSPVPEPTVTLLLAFAAAALLRRRRGR